MLPLAVLSAAPARAQESLPSSVRLDGLAMVWQDVNRCSAAAFTIQLSYWIEEPVNYREVIGRMNPNPRDLSVRVEEMVEIAQERYGLMGVVRRGGTLELMKALVAAGFPVLVENSYYEGGNAARDWMSHNRVLMGYDDALGEFYVFDSLLGNGPDRRGRAFAYDDFDRRWLAFNRDYVVLFPPERAATVQLILGEMWDEAANARFVIEQAQADLEIVPSRMDRAFALLNLAYGYFHTGQLEAAVAAVDEALGMNALPWRYFWYEFTALDVYVAAGRYDDVQRIVSSTLAGLTGIVEELYYYAGVAAEAQGDTRRALNNYRAAVQGNLYYIAASDALRALEAALAS
ncbi:C39 family peptidase [Aggregatilineales bacterium SYSU G02658]